MPDDEDVKRPGNMGRSGTYPAAPKTNPEGREDTARTVSNVAVVRGVYESLRVGLNELLLGNRDDRVRNLIQRAVWRAQDDLTDLGLGEHIVLQAEISDTVKITLIPRTEFGRRILLRAKL